MRKHLILAVVLALAPLSGGPAEAETANRLAVEAKKAWDQAQLETDPRKRIELLESVLERFDRIIGEFPDSYVAVLAIGGEKVAGITRQMVEEQVRSLQRDPVECVSRRDPLCLIAVMANKRRSSNDSVLKILLAKEALAYATKAREEREGKIARSLASFALELLSNETREPSRFYAAKAYDILGDTKSRDRALSAAKRSALDAAENGRGVSVLPEIAVFENETGDPLTAVKTVDRVIGFAETQSSEKLRLVIPARLSCPLRSIESLDDNYFGAAISFYFRCQESFGSTFEDTNSLRTLFLTRRTMFYGKDHTSAALKSLNTASATAKSIKNQLERARVRLEIAEAYASRGLRRESMDLLREIESDSRSLEPSEDDPWALPGLFMAYSASLYWRLGFEDQALAELGRAFEAVKARDETKDPYLLIWIAHQFAEAGQIDRAYAVLDTAGNQLRQRESRLLVDQLKHLAASFIKIGRSSSAIPYLELAKRRSQDWQRGTNDEANDAIARVIHAGNLSDIAMLYHKAGNAAASEEAFAAAVREHEAVLDDERPSLSDDMFRDLILAYLALGQFDRVIDVLSVYDPDEMGMNSTYEWVLLGVVRSLWRN